MIKIENNVPIPDDNAYNIKYKEVFDTFDQMEKDQSIVVDTIKAVNSLRKYAKDKQSNICYRKISENEFRVWRIR